MTSDEMGSSCPKLTHTTHSPVDINEEGEWKLMKNQRKKTRAKNTSVLVGQKERDPNYIENKMNMVQPRKGKERDPENDAGQEEYQQMHTGRSLWGRVRVS